MGQTVETDGVGVLLRIGRIDAVDLGALEERVGADLGGAQRCGGIRGEKRIAGSAGEDDDPALARDGASAARCEKVSQISGMEIADSTTESMPSLRSEVASASELMTVASMPMWSPVTRSPPLEATATPRKMLPPPMTTPTSTPELARFGDVGGDAVGDRRRRCRNPARP